MRSLKWKYDWQNGMEVWLTENGMEIWLAENGMETQSDAITHGRRVVTSLHKAVIQSVSIRCSNLWNVSRHQIILCWLRYSTHNLSYTLITHTCTYAHTHTHLQLFSIQVWHAGPIVNHFVHEWLSEGGVIQLIVAPAHTHGNIKSCTVTQIMW